jgi:hypothetical protein
LERHQSGEPAKWPGAKAQLGHEFCNRNPRAALLFQKQHSWASKRLSSRMSGDFIVRSSSSSRAAKYAATLVLATTLAASVWSGAYSQPADPNYQAQAQDYQAKQQQYEAAKQDYQAKQAAHEDATDAYRDRRAIYSAQRADYAAQKRDYERARADYDARYGPGAFDTYTRTVTTTRTYTPAGAPDASVTTVRKEVIEH